MRRVRLVAAIAYGVFVLLLLAKPVRAEVIRSTFAGGAVQGWSTAGGGIVRADPSYGGFLVFEYAAGFPGEYVLVAPSSFRGDLSRFDRGILSFDVLHPDWQPTDPPILTFGPEEFGRIIISGGAGQATLDLVTGPKVGSFLDTSVVQASYSGPLEAQAWGLTPAQWSALLADVDAITLNFNSGRPLGTTLGLDNFQISSLESALSAVPEPAAVTLFGLGILGWVGLGRLLRKRAR